MAPHCSTSGMYFNINSTPTGALPGPFVRPDGIWDGFNNVQGARVYDPSVGQWTAPDAYEGDIRDPASQRPYMYNNSNPYIYQDPSGYDPNFIQNIAKSIGDFFNNLASKYDAGPASPALEKAVGDRVNVTSRSIRDHLTKDDVSGAIKEAQTGQPTIVNGKPYDHVEEVQQAINGINKTIDHLDGAARNFRDSPSDLSTLNNVRGFLNGVKADIQSQFDQAGVGGAIKF